MTILKKNSGERITSITYGGRKIDGYFVAHRDLETGKKLVITTNSSDVFQTTVPSLG